MRDRARTLSVRLIGEVAPFSGPDRPAKTRGARSRKTTRVDAGTRRPSGAGIQAAVAPGRALPGARRRPGSSGSGRSATIRPPSRMTACSHSSTAISRSWVAISLVAGSPAIRPRNRRRPRGSRLAVGSSRTRTVGSHARTPARQTRFRSPKLRWCGGRSAGVDQVDLLQASRASRRASAFAMPRLSGPKATSSSTEVRTAGRRGPGRPGRPGGGPRGRSGRHRQAVDPDRRAGRRPARRRVAPCAWRMPRPRPEPGRTPLRWSSRVLLPAPLGPTRATDSPASIGRSTPRSAARPSG